MQITPSHAHRQDRLALLARAHRGELAEPFGAFWPDLGMVDLRQPEIGLVMLRGRMGGDGAPFNMGEATMTRAAVQLATGERGFGQVLGRQPDIARLIAIFDALALREPETVEQKVLAPIRARISAERQDLAERTAATRVDFFTLVRGDPES